MSSTAPIRPFLLAIGGLFALAAAMGLGRFIYTPILPLMLEDLGLSKGQGGLIASANYAGYLAGAVIASIETLPGSRRAWLIGALATSALTTAVTGMVSSMPAFLIIRLIAGLASAFVLVFASTLIMERLMKAGRGNLFSLYFAGVGVGIVLSAVLVSTLSFAGHGWRIHWIAGGLVSIAALILVVVLVPGQTEPPHRRVQQTKTTGLKALVLAYGLLGFGYVITATFLVAIARDAPEIKPLEPYIWLVVGLTAAPSVALWTWVSSYIGAGRAFALGCWVQAIGVAASVLWITPAGILLAAGLLGGTFVGATAVGLMSARELSSGDPRRALAIMTASFGLGQIIGPVFAGFVFDLSGSFVVSSLIAVAALAMAAIIVPVTRRQDI